MRNRNRKRKKSGTGIILFVFAAIIVVVAYFAYRYNFIFHLKFTDKRFGIERIKSSTDADNDGVEDYEDILLSAKEYIATKPKYKSNYYENGYPDDGYGVCTDVVGFALLNAGYDLRELVDEDIRNHPEDYDIDKPDSKIDFRRVVNLKVYFDHTAESLTTDYTDYEAWQAGDIVIWNGHIGLISEHRNWKGIPFVYHNASPMQVSYEEDVLEAYGEVLGHYRLKDVG